MNVKSLFERDGFVVVDNALSAAMIDALRAECGSHVAATGSDVDVVRGGCVLPTAVR